MIEKAVVHILDMRLKEDAAKQNAFIFADTQIEAGADIITVADHAKRDLRSPLSYRDFLIPVHSPPLQKK
ncbi:MAG: hypothetical protein ACYDIA_18205 [Candidatus Humimicrobiaceae bacterium]